ncbi:hypothetical protein GCM10010339_11100 [Streptomyces alanosinicus]|uniref:Uncharacterized protein n=1 Tax=Streptomyces alanosinicus TaxID=68171 RepID=A0A919D0U1_9ACTN|nr:hypothetical protein GCM10010339_11100 [Streptomyces alanosinicus]
MPPLFLPAAEANAQATEETEPESRCVKSPLSPESWTKPKSPPLLGGLSADLPFVVSFTGDADRCRNKVGIPRVGGGQAGRPTGRLASCRCPPSGIYGCRPL